MFQALEDNQVSLSTMKASHFVRAFEQEVDRWERQLSVVLEVTEMVLTVQRQWIYLEVTLRMMQGNRACWEAGKGSALKQPTEKFSPDNTIFIFVKISSS